jgi:hypothetical protein
VATAIHSVEVSGLGRFMREALYAYPVAEATHIVGIAMLFGSIALVDLRLLGLGRSLPVRSLVAFAAPWSLVGFVVAASAGLLMFTAHATEFLTQPLFMLKMGLIAAGGINAAMLHTGPLRRLEADAMPPARVRAAAALSLGVWITVIVCGRFLAYV